jgi:hypothetical protein
MSRITDEFMKEQLKKLKGYTMVVLHRTTKSRQPGVDKLVWEHGRRNMELRLDGVICIVCPGVVDETDFAGLYIMSTGVETTKKIMDGDPTVKEGIFTYEVHAIEGFPGDSLK